MERSSTLSSHSAAAVLLTTYTQRDILCGRGGLTNRHAGNRLYRRLIQHNKPIYQALQNKQRQNFLIQSIFKAVEASNGRFLRKEGKHWVHLSDKEAFEKVKQAIREPDSKYAATCSIKSDQTITSSCRGGDTVSGSSAASTASTFSQQESEIDQDNLPIDAAEVKHGANKMDDDDDLDNVSCFSDFSIDGPVAPLSRGTSTFMEDINGGITFDSSVPFAKMDFNGFILKNSLLPPSINLKSYAQTGLLGRKPRKHSRSLLLDADDSPMPSQLPMNIVCPIASVSAPACGEVSWNLPQQQMPTDFAMFVTPQASMPPQICPCKVHQMNSNILAYNLQLQAMLEAQLQQVSQSQAQV
ncbi:hypothetical protein MPSEU_000935200 [Mayamaea pseudoterrestris]|nr:hypothetical protein MPSEU_000935200 [Mayamaea pseudoterrestris]